MISDKIENYKRYTSLSGRIAAALEYIANTDFTIIDPGRYEIDGDNIYVIISDYVTKNRDDCRLEAHRKYIDVQYVAEGCEFFGYAPLANQIALTEYDELKDCIFYKDDASFIKLSKKMFAIFFPDDLHMPGTGISPSRVKKVVVKVKI